MDRNPVGWFEIPVEDMDRAVEFYETVFDFDLKRHKLDSLEMAWFPMHEDKVGSPGSLVMNWEYYKPSKGGILIYFTSPSGDLRNELGKVEDAGGKILENRKKISDEYGYMGLFLDTEGNRIAVHSRK